MRFEHVPLLAKQRELYGMARDMKRFHAYLAELTQGTREAALAPLGWMNPMAREPVRAAVNALLDAGAEDAAADAARVAGERLAGVAGPDVRTALVVSDDVGGTWSDRDHQDLKLRTGTAIELKRGWTSALVWMSEPPRVDLVRPRILAAAYRAAWVHAHGPPRTLGDVLRQEGAAAVFAGSAHASAPFPEPALARARGVLARHEAASDEATLFACLFGDAAAERFGHAPLGVPARGGLVIAALDARAAGAEPVRALG